MPTLNRRILLWLAGLVLVGGFVLALWPKPVPVDLAQITTGPMAVTIDEEGKTRIKDIFTVSAPVSGHMLRPSVKAGDPVEAGKTQLAAIEPSVPPFLDARTRSELEASLKASEAAVTLAEANLETAQSELAFAEDELTRARRLARSGTIPDRQLDQTEHKAIAARSAKSAAIANVEMRRRERDALVARLGTSAASDPTAGCCVTVTAPASGRVLAVLADSARDIAAGTPILEIGDPANLEIVVELLSTDAVQVAEGASVEIVAWGGAGSLTGMLRRIEPAGFTKVSALGIEEQRVRVLIDLTSPPATYARLGHDFRVFVHIASWSSGSALRVPIAALFRSGADWAVYRYEAGKARVAPVTIGHRNDEVAEVLDGLSAGDRVLLYPSDLVADGAKVTER